jgi:NAD(P)-dependent dehydrogenase (short-subunit alcohol dehydrogenase family)
MKPAYRKLIVLGAAATGAAILSKLVSKPLVGFRDRSVLITGGSRGLGLEIARRFACEGARLTILGRDVPSLESARAELKQIGGKVLAISCDIRNQEDVQAAVRETIARFGGIDVLVNNAGIIQVGPLEEVTTDDFEDALATHLWGSLYSIQAVLPHMRQQRFGRIVNICSIVGKIAVPHLLPYTASKFALAGLSEGLAAELPGSGICVTSVFPGLMRTGSHVNALFKGDHEKEFAWSSIGGSMPVLTINASRAAAQIVEAARRGRKSLVITPAAKVAALAHGIAPGLVILALRMANVLLPKAPIEYPNTARKGWQSSSWISPSPLTRLSDKVIDRNNEQLVRGRIYD